MKAYLDYERKLHIESETPEEAKELRVFMDDGARHGFYHYSSGATFTNTGMNHMSGRIAVDNE